MEKLSLIKVNKRRVNNNSTIQNPINETINSSINKELICYADGRCLGNFNPSVLLENLSKNLLEFKNVERLVNKNEELKLLLDKYKLDLKNNNYKTMLHTNEHMKQTAVLAGKICDNINLPVNKNRIIKAARLHDVGKIFIPSSILDKTHRLTKEEKQIMDVHSELGHKLLETLKIDSKTLDLIKNHHNYNKNSSIEQQIVSAADVYTALTEVRPYKKPTPKNQAVEIISQYNLSQDVVDALRKAVA